MKTKDFFYELPDELIAQDPIYPRDASRLLVLYKASGKIEHLFFKDLVDLLGPEDCLVLNDTRVIPARLFGLKKDTKASIEFLLLNRKSKNIWEVILRPGKRAKIGSQFIFGNGELVGKVIDIVDGGNRIVEFDYEGVFENILESLGNMPLPPYITRVLEDKERYQTIYSKHDGSAAAPTAGLHFTEELLKKIADKGTTLAYITLHVGLGTFRPVKVTNVKEHKMHSEYFDIGKETAETINTFKSKGGRIICVGTTSVRAIEHAADENGIVHPKKDWTDIFIYPGYRFKTVDGIITNFHLPESTLLMLVSAIADKDNIMNAYTEAIDLQYRFFSFGDAMIII